MNTTDEQIKDITENIAEVELTYKTKVKASDRIQIQSANNCAEIFQQIWEKDGDIEHVESFRIMILNRTNKILGVKLISKGGIAGTVADIRVMLQTAIKANASGIIISHNHPSGNLKPSEADITLTKKLSEACKIMDISLLDHVIIIPNDTTYFSFADEGII